MFTYERFGLFTSIVGLVADFIALATLGYSLVNLGESESTVGIIFWLGMLAIMPLTYFWGFLTWLVNSKFGRTVISTLTLGVMLAPLYLLWGVTILGAPMREETIRNLYIWGYLFFFGFWALFIQIILGFIILIVIKLWVSLLRQQS
jgi:hypothetical protein